MESVPFQVCRTCLATNVRMQELQPQDVLIYSALIGIQSPCEGALPASMCYQCSMHMHKLKAFSTKARRAHDLLMDLIRNRGQIFETDIRKIDRVKNNLQSSLTQVETQSLESNSDAYECGKEYGCGKVEQEKKDYIQFDIDEKSLLQHEIKSNNIEMMLLEDITDSFLLDGTREQNENIDVKYLNKKANKSQNSLTKTSKVKIIRGIPVKRNAKGTFSLEGKTNAEAGRRGSQCDLRSAKTHKQEYYSFATITVMNDAERRELFEQRRERSKYLTAPYKCTDCYIGFVYKSVYDNHRLKHDPSAGAYPCPLCKVRLRSARICNKHVCMNHRTKFACKKCPYVCSNAIRAQNHEYTHMDASYRCEQCNRTFARLLTYKQHVSTKHPEELPCGDCGVTFLGRAALREHRAECPPGDVAKGEASYVCTECGVKFRSAKALRVHVATFGRHNAEGATKLLECQMCTKRFSDKQSALQHRKTHKVVPLDEAVAEPCEQCGEMVAGGRAYYTHFRRAHPDKTRTRFFSATQLCMCEVCGQFTQSLSSLQMHSLKHTGERPFKCDVCGKSFRLKEHQTTHARVHTREQPYKCGACGLAFSCASNLHRHRVVHEEAKPYPCDICGKMFKRRHLIAGHVRHVHLKQSWPKRDRSKRKPAGGNLTADDQTTAGPRGLRNAGLEDSSEELC